MSLRNGMPFALRQFETKGSYTCRDNNCCRKLQNFIPLSTERDWPSANNLPRQINRRFDFAKFRSNGVITSGLLSQPFSKLGIALHVRQRFSKLRIRVVHRSAIQKQSFFGLARVHLAFPSGGFVSLSRRKS